MKKTKCLVCGFMFRKQRTQKVCSKTNGIPVPESHTVRLSPCQTIYEQNYKKKYKKTILKGQARIQALQDAKKEGEKLRECLRCEESDDIKDRMFLSRSPANRVCVRCANKSEGHITPKISREIKSGNFINWADV